MTDAVPVLKTQWAGLWRVGPGVGDNSADSYCPAFYGIAYRGGRRVSLPL